VPLPLLTFLPLRLKLSDGISFITALMGESVFNKMVSALLFQLAQKVRQKIIQTFQIWSLTIYVLQAKLPEQWDIVCINKFSRLDVKGQKILLVRDVI
jgi:hypothetical protein